MECYCKLFKEDQILCLNLKLNITKVTINAVLTEYISYLKSRIDAGHSVKFLNICYLRVNGEHEDVYETLAYIGTEIAHKLGISPVVAGSILLAYEEMITDELSDDRGVTVRGLVRIRLENGKVRIKKSTVYNGYDVYITTLPKFKRKVEVSVA